jgi:hypothetical protein
LKYQMGFMRQKNKKMVNWPRKKWWILVGQFLKVFADTFHWKPEISDLNWLKLKLTLESEVVDYLHKRA